MKNTGNHKRSKHFSIEFDALREFVKKREIDVRYMQTTNMPADMLTKVLNKHTFTIHRDYILFLQGRKREKDIERKDKNYEGCGRCELSGDEQSEGDGDNRRLSAVSGGQCQRRAQHRV